MTIDAIVGRIGNAVLEPLDEHVGLVERRVLDLAERLHPMNTLGLFGPKSVRIGKRLLIHLPVLRFVDESAFGPIGRHFINLVGHFALLRSPADLCCRSLLMDVSRPHYAWAQRERTRL